MMEEEIYIKWADWVAILGIGDSRSKALRDAEKLKLFGRFGHRGLKGNYSTPVHGLLGLSMFSFHSICSRIYFSAFGGKWSQQKQASFYYNNMAKWQASMRHGSLYDCTNDELEDLYRRMDDLWNKLAAFIEKNYKEYYC